MNIEQSIHTSKQLQMLNYCTGRLKMIWPFPDKTMQSSHNDNAQLKAPSSESMYHKESSLMYTHFEHAFQSLCPSNQQTIYCEVCPSRMSVKRRHARPQLSPKHAPSQFAPTSNTMGIEQPKPCLHPRFSTTSWEDLCQMAAPWHAWHYFSLTIWKVVAVVPIENNPK
jgi:hypothetical protein